MSCPRQGKPCYEFMCGSMQGGICCEHYIKNQTKRIYDDYKCNEKVTLELLDKYKENIFATEFVSDEEATILYNTILYWKNSANKQ